MEASRPLDLFGRAFEYVHDGPKEFIIKHNQRDHGSKTGRKTNSSMGIAASPSGTSFLARPLQRFGNDAQSPLISCKLVGHDKHPAWKHAV